MLEAPRMSDLAHEETPQQHSHHGRHRHPEASSFQSVLFVSTWAPAASFGHILV